MPRLARTAWSEPMPLAVDDALQPAGPHRRRVLGNEAGGMPEGLPRWLEKAVLAVTGQFEDHGPGIGGALRHGLRIVFAEDAEGHIRPPSEQRRQPTPAPAHRSVSN